MTIDIGELAALRERCGELENRTDAQARELAALRATCREVAGELRELADTEPHGTIADPWLTKLAYHLDPPQGTEGP